MTSTAVHLDQEELFGQVHRALAAWGNLSSTEDELLASLLLVQERRASEGDVRNKLARRRITNDLLAEAIDQLAEQNEREAQVLRARFIEGEITRQVAARLYASPDQVNRWQRSAIQHLTEVLLGRELTLRDERRRELTADLPPPTYSRLFGLAEAQTQVLSQLLQEEPAWIVAISGIGGIGKTSLADAVARRASETFHFQRLHWFRAADRGLSGRAIDGESIYGALVQSIADRLWPESAPGEPSGTRAARVQETMREQPHLLIVDNIETESATAFLLDRLQALTRPSKCLLTTRARPAVAPDVFLLTLGELPFEAAAELLRSQAEIAGLAELVEADDETLSGVYQAAGGNPLALKLVVSLAAVMPLGQIVVDLAASATRPVEEMYRYIYWNAWRSLSPDAQTLLQAMPLVAEAGALPKQMQAMSRLPDGSFWSAVTELVSRSLLEVQGTAYERRYGIHRLTDSFLRTEIIHWPDEEEPQLEQSQDR